MGLNSSQYGALAGGLVSIYSPTVGNTVNSLFSKPRPEPVATIVPAPPTAPFTPTPAVNKVPMALWIGGGAVILVLVLIIALKK